MEAQHNVLEKPSQQPCPLWLHPLDCSYLRQYILAGWTKIVRFWTLILKFSLNINLAIKHHFFVEEWNVLIFLSIFLSCFLSICPAVHRHDSWQPQLELYMLQRCSFASTMHKQFNPWWASSGRSITEKRQLDYIPPLHMLWLRFVLANLDGHYHWTRSFKSYYWKDPLLSSSRVLGC